MQNPLSLQAFSVWLDRQPKDETYHACPVNTHSPKNLLDVDGHNAS